MTSDEFVYWLQGYMELADPENMGKRELSIIQEHLSLVLHKVTQSPLKDSVLGPLHTGEPRKFC